MSRFNDFLSKLNVGDLIQLTQSNGQILEGTVIENDKEDSLSLQVSSTMMIRYNSIDSVSVLTSLKTQNILFNQSNKTVGMTENTEQTADIKTMTAIVDLPKIKPLLSKDRLYDFDVSEDTFKMFADELDVKDKNILESTCSTLLTGYQQDDENSTLAASVNLNRLVESKVISDYKKSLKVAAYGSYLAANYSEAIKLFYYGDHLREAYLSAYNAAYRLNEDLTCYCMAAVMSVLYMLSQNSDEHFEEAAACLREVSIKCKDISGIAFLVENSNTAIQLAYAYEILNKVCDKLKINISNIKEIKDILLLVKDKYKSSVISEMISEMKKEKADYEYKRENETDDNAISESEKEEPDTTGEITKLNFFEDKGKITGKSGKIYDFEFNDIVDSTFRKTIKSGKLKKNVSIPVTFEIDNTYRNPIAVKIERRIVSKNNDTVLNSVSKSGTAISLTDDPNKLFSNKEYENALVIYMQWLAEGKLEDGFVGAVQCILSLLKIHEDKQSEYIEELKRLAEEYGNKLPVTVKAYSSLIQVYTKYDDLQKIVDAIDKMEQADVFKDENQKCHFLVLKAGSYKKMYEFEKAIEAYVEIARFVDKNNLYDKKESVRNITYVEICESYLELGDYQQAKYYYDMSGYNTKKPELKKRIEELEKQKKAVKVETIQETVSDIDTEAVVKEPEDEYETESAQTDDSTDNTQEIISEEADNYEVTEYTDSKAFENLITSDREIITTALSFKDNQQECMITYLTAAAEICRLYENDKKSDYSEMTAADTIISVSELVNTAFAAYGFEKHIDADKLIYYYQNCSIAIPEISDNLLLSAALRMSFSDRTIQTFEIERIVLQIEKMPSDKYKPTILSLIDLFKTFNAQTGYCMDIFADYNTNSQSVQAIIDSAKECREYIEQRIKTYESQGRLRRARELMFYDENSVISYALQAVCNNDTGKAAKIKKEIISEFLRNGDELDVDNIDVKKLDAFIDSKWDIARDMIIAEKRHVERPYDNLKGGKRNNIIIMLKRAIDCICRWINASESAAVTKDSYSLGQYTARRNDVVNHLQNLNNQLSSELEESFDWGICSLYGTIHELLEKMEGSYNPSSKKYTAYTNFLKTNYILLDGNFVPEINSTFSDLPGFDIFSRIKAHANSELPDFRDRIKQIFSDNINNSNFRCAELIKQYGEYFKIEEITGDPLFDDLDECIKSSKKRTTYFYKDFKNELELDESYGSISDVTGYKTFVGTNIDVWYNYAMSSCDFGFFSDLVDAYRKAISKNAEVTAKKLAKQLSDLAADPNYDFGVYSVQQIQDHIEDRNFAIAENILNCIRRNDTKNITDFTQEPKSIFDNFMAEYDALYRAVSDTKVTLIKSLTTYFGKNNIEIVLRKVTNNMNKDVRGGIALINSWPTMKPTGIEKISKFINLLGFKDSVVTKDNSFSTEDIYIVERKKQTGKITYPHPIPAFGSLSEDEGFRVLVLYGRFDTDRLLDKFREINTVSKNTIVILDSVLNQEERRRLARKIKEEKSFSISFIVIDRVLLFYLAKHYQSNTISRMLMATTMPFSFNQPFCPKPNTPLPVELFTGRKEELNKIESYDGINLLYGGRQLGKSSLLEMAKHNIDRNALGDRAIVINIKERNYTEAAKKVSGELVLNDILPEGSECDDWDTLTMNIKKRLKDESQEKIHYLLIMLDEADIFIESCKDIKYRPITALKDLLSPQFKFVLAGLHNLSKYNYEAVYSNNSDIAHLESYVVRPFKRPEAIELLTHALGYLGFVFSDDVINLILAKTNYFPGLIHLYGQKLLEAMTNDDYAGYSETETPYYYVTENHIKKVLADPDFKYEIKNKLVMTLEVNGKENSPYYIIALLLAYLYYEEAEKGSKSEFTIDDIMEKAKAYEINILLQYTREQIKELLCEMWDLNILSAKGDYYMFSTEGFRELLGTKEDVNTELSKYMGR